MRNKKFLGYWDSVWEFLEDFLGAIGLFVLLFCGLWLSYIFG
jgi:hypothetical protein